MYLIRIFFIELISKLIQFFRFYYFKIKGYYNIEKGVILESNLNFDKVYPNGIYIKKGTLVASGVTILCHEHVKRDPNNSKLPFITNTIIGKNCFIGVNSIILPGVIIGDSVIIGAHTVVTKNIPNNSIAVGNPAKILSKNVVLNDKAILVNSYV
jgi:acetyltransferase-like isoleucine patch superfamily enzyme